MKYIKLLNLAAVAAMAVMAFGAGSASATGLYEGNTRLGLGAEIHAWLSPGTSASLTTTEGTLLNTCTESTVKGTITNAGSSSSTVVGSVLKEDLVWSGCKETVDTVAGGDLEIHWTSGLNGTVTGKKFKVTVLTPFGSCVFTTGAATPLGTFTGSTTTNAVLDINAVVTRETGLCPLSARWVGNYTITTSPMHATAS